MKRSKISCSAIILFMLLACCASASFAQSNRAPAARPSPSPAPPPDPLPATQQTGVRLDVTGKFNGLVYTNSALGFTLTLPPGWQVQDSDVQQQFAEATTKKAAEVKEGRAAAQASLSRTTLLFIVIKPTDQRINPTIIGLAEDIRLAFSTRTVHQYLESMRSISIDSPFVFDANSTTERINGVEFGLLGSTPKEPHAPAMANLRQRYYVIIRRNHALGFILTYDGPEQLQACMEVLNTFKLQ